MTVASLNLQNHGTPTEDIQDVFNPQIVEESSDEEEVPQENIMAIPVPGPSLEILHTLQEIPPSPGPSLCQFLLEPIIIASSIPLLGSSPQLLGLLVKDSTVGVGATVEEFEEAVSREAEMDVVRARFSGPLFQPYLRQLHTRSTYISLPHDLCPHQDQEKTMSSIAKNAILLQNQAANKVYNSTLFPSKSKSPPSSTPYPASTTSSTRLATSSS